MEGSTRRKRFEVGTTANPAPSRSDVKTEKMNPQSTMQNGSAIGPHDQSLGPPGRLKRLGGIICGSAYLYSQALQASRAEIIRAVDGDDAVDTLVMVNGHRGTDHAADSTNRIRSDEHPDCTGVDTVYIAVTPRQFKALAARVGATVKIRKV